MNEEIKQEDSIENTESAVVDNSIEKLIEENNSLKLELKKYQEIAANSQSQYMNLKFDFDWFIKRVEREKQEWNVKSLLDNFALFALFIEDLRKSIEDVPAEIEKNNWVKWVALLYVNLIKRLQEVCIHQIKAIWLEPDPQNHEPISMMEVEDENMKWKIVKECEIGFYYQKWDTKIIIKPSKVIVWS